MQPLAFLPDRPSVYMASDLHLGAPDATTSRIREKRFTQWMDSIQPQAAGLILLGDIFDFWFEYKHAIPKGFSRLQGKLAEWSDAGIPVYIFTGNHDLWMKDYFSTELGIPVFHHPMELDIFGHRCLIGHGDGLGPGDHGFKAMKKLFQNPLAQWAFKWMHPDLGIPLANYFSGSSRKAHRTKDAIHYGEKEFLFQFAKTTAIQKPEIQYYIFGHRHRPEEIPISPNARMINLGDWINHNTYLEMNLNEVKLCVWKS
jgi:UDP-2,3-diacylglucosamine hydrolase